MEKRERYLPPMKHVGQGEEEESVEEVGKIMKCNKTNSCSQLEIFGIWLSYEFSLLSYFLKIFLGLFGISGLKVYSFEEVLACWHYSPSVIISVSSFVSVVLVSLVHDFSMRPFGMFGTFCEM